MSILQKTDIEIYDLIEMENKRQQNNIELIASENFTSKAVMEAMGSVLTNKYAEGYPNKRYYGGCNHIDSIETLAIERVKKLFNAEHANVQPHSGSSANMAVYMSVLKPNDTVLGMSLSEGGHLTHGSKVNFSGKLYNFIPYGIKEETGEIDYEQMQKLATEHKPKLIVCGASAYPRKINFKKIREICDSVDAYFMVDIAHIAGLIIAGVHESPVEIADFVTSTTHKTLRGPRGGLILCKEKYATMIDKSIFPGIQGGPLEHIIAGKAVSFLEASKESFVEYQKQVIKNAKVMENVFKKEKVEMVTGGTDNHLILLNLTNTRLTGYDLENLLDEINITVNKNSVPNDKQKPTITSGIRLGTPCITTRGMKEKESEEIAEIISEVIKNENPDLEKLRNRVKNLCEKFPLYN